MRSPKLIKRQRDGTHRLIPYRYSDRGTPTLNLLAENDDDLLRDLTELEGATNDRLLGESGRLAGITALELVSGFQLAHIVNASFTHASPSGSRFNGPERGAWYAAFEMETAQKEMAFHKAAELKEVGWKAEEVSPYIGYLADFRHEFHDIRNDPDFTDCLAPNSYHASQALGRQLLTSGSAGVLYPSVRHKDGVCIACFRPPLVLNVQEGDKVTFTFVNAEVSAVTIEN
ncbi:MAG TPA: RES family NAD+ phosphorylase, partial [Candidatus Angelobacter sp.]|nr:RES family NAD+ phosphorylase [Candidatus Angelobacter sp.]